MHWLLKNFYSSLFVGAGAGFLLAGAVIPAGLLFTVAGILIVLDAVKGGK